MMNYFLRWHQGITSRSWYLLPKRFERGYFFLIWQQKIIALTHFWKKVATRTNLSLLIGRAWCHLNQMEYCKWEQGILFILFSIQFFLLFFSLFSYSKFFIIFAILFYCYVGTHTGFQSTALPAFNIDPSMIPLQCKWIFSPSLGFPSYTTASNIH